jgi:TonB family protein
MMVIHRSARGLLFLLTILICVACVPIWSQTNGGLERLRSLYKGKIVFLREEVTRGSWTLAGFKIADVEPTAKGAEITGDRVAIVYAEGKQGFVTLAKSKIVPLPISNPDAETELNAAFDKIFIKPETEDLRPMVPEYWRYFLAGNDFKSREEAWQAAVDESKIPTFKKLADPTSKLTPPVVVHNPDPNYTKEAAAHHVEGVSHLAIVVDSTGAVVKSAILQPLGIGLDEQALLAVNKWKFRPSTFNGKPVQAQIRVEITFRCCPY